MLLILLDEEKVIRCSLIWRIVEITNEGKNHIVYYYKV